MRLKAGRKRWAYIARSENPSMVLERLNEFFWNLERGRMKMKIQNGSSSIVSIDLKKMKGTEKVVTDESTKAARSTGETTVSRSSIDVKVSQTLRDTLDMISEAGLSAGEVHSNVNESRVMGLLKSMDVEAKRPQLDAEMLLKLADKLSEDMQNNPTQAKNVFKDLDPKRVADLI